MRKVALVFVLAVLVPSLGLAWLAVRSLWDQQYLLERQQSLLYQHVTDTLAQNISARLAEQQQEFTAMVETLAATNAPPVLALQFDEQIRKALPLAEVGFTVQLSDRTTSVLACPLPTSSPEALKFCADNGGFLRGSEPAEVYNLSGNNAIVYQKSVVNQDVPAIINNADNFSAQQASNFKNGSPTIGNGDPSGANYANSKSQARSVTPQSQNFQTPAKQAQNSPDANVSKVVPAEAEFRQLIGDDKDGMFGRFLQNKLKLMFWHRQGSDSNSIFGAQLNLPRLMATMQDLVQPDPALRDEICIAILDDTARPVALSRPGFLAAWKRPFVATEIGEALPHWEIAAYVVNPERITRAVCNTNIAFGLLIALLVVAISFGGWLIVTDLNRQLALARQKTDFVSNVSHELKTPLTSIRMFSELLAEHRVADPAKQRAYLQIITAETARLTRLINNVLDFSRLERNEKKYNFRDADFSRVVGETVETYRPHLENSGFELECDFTPGSLPVRVDADAVAQIIVNLLSNSEKYSNGEKKIRLETRRREGPLPCAELAVLDRGSGVPRGSEEKIFEKFYRAHDCLSSGIQGSGLGLTLARQIARAHGGDVIYEPRPDGGSCFSLRLPLLME